ncbi:response regulator transcription factor [Novosphingobium sp. BW1]|nr:response regulator transcription factor [Novosphingobium sp. BW1]TYC91406.1 response regulator transcription factor [Novosphingobium sp. BW1]
MEAGQVCIIDDDEGVRASLSSLLRASGYTVQTCRAPEQFRAEDLGAMPSCLVLDVQMPGESGLDFQERLCASGFAVPVIFITGHGDIPMTVRGMRAGAVDFLPKPFTENDLLEAVGRALDVDRERLRREAIVNDLQSRHDALTPREKEVMALVITGLMNKQVAGHLDLSEITVKIHRGNVMRKMGAQSLADLVRMAESLGIRDTSIHRFGPKGG